jgi:hypothetical protein
MDKTGHVICQDTPKKENGTGTDNRGERDGDVNDVGDTIATLGGDVTGIVTGTHGQL